MGKVLVDPIGLVPPKFVNEEAEMYMQPGMFKNQMQQTGESILLAEALSQSNAQTKVIEQVDPYTLDIIAKLFPSNGLEFLALVLQNAQIIQNVLPDQEALGEHVAIINTRTIRTLASAIHWGYDTTHKYVAVFGALNLFLRIKHNKERQIIFPLKRYEPPLNLQSLDQLIVQSRPKVCQFARKVKERFLLLGMVSTSKQSSNDPLLPLECDMRLHSALFSPMLAVIKSEGIDTAKGQHIVLRLVSEVINKIIFPLQVSTPEEKNSPQAIPNGTLPQTVVIQPERVYHKQPESTHTQTESRPYKRKVSLRSQSKQTKVTSAAEKEVTTVDSYEPEQHRVSPADSLESLKRSKPVDSVLQILDIYQDLLESGAVDWKQMGLPKDFFEQLHMQINTYYLRLHDGGLLARTKGHIWASVELSIIKKLAIEYGVDSADACTYVFQCTGREYQPGPQTKTAVYATRPEVDPKPVTYNTNVESPYLPPVDRYEPKVDQHQHKEDFSRTESTEKKTFSKYSIDTQVDPYQTQSTVNQTQEDSLATQYQPVVDPQQNTNIEHENSPEAALDAEAIRVRNYCLGIDIGETQAKILRIPSQVDSKDYGDEFNNVLRKRNINILFNNIYTNVTLRKDGATFLTHVFDTKDTEKVKKQNENLLRKNKPEVVLSAFVDTVLSMHEPGHDSLQNPGAYFTSRCKYYQNNATDEETVRVVEIYSNMTYETLAAEMQIVINSGKKVRTKAYRVH